MKWNAKRDLVLGYFGVLFGILASGWFIKIAMLIDDPCMILFCVILGCLFLIEMIASCMLVMGVYERKEKIK